MVLKDCVTANYRLKLMWFRVFAALLCQNRFIARCATVQNSSTHHVLMRLSSLGPVSSYFAETYFDKMIPHSDNIEGTCQSPTLASAIQDFTARYTVLDLL